MTPQTHNLFEGIPAEMKDEFFQTLAESGGTRIERIVSDGHATPVGQWYNQGWDEWVLIISGGATLLYGSDSPPLCLKSGDHVMIPAGCRHRVDRTNPEEKTIWLAVHFGGN